MLGLVRGMFLYVVLLYHGGGVGEITLTWPLYP